MDWQHKPVRARLDIRIMAFEYPLQSELDVKTAANHLRVAGIACEWSGVCLWITSDLDDAQELRIIHCGDARAVVRVVAQDEGADDRGDREEHRGDIWRWQRVRRVRV